MDISKADAVAQLAKWRDSGTKVQALYSSITGRLSIIGEITELSQATIGIRGSGCEMVLYFRETSKFDYSDRRQASTEANKDRVNKYPAVIETRFTNSDRLEIMEFFS